MNILSSALHFFSSLLRPKPARDWFLALVCVVVLFVCLASYAGYLYISIDSGAAFAGEQQPATPTIPLTRATIQDVLEAYRTRSLNYTAHNLPAPLVVDPAHTLETTPPKQ